VNAKNILLLGLLTIVLFPLAGFGIHYFLGEGSFWSIFTTKSNYPLEIAIGIGTGTLGGLLGWFVITRKLLKPALNKYKGLIGTLRLNTTTIILVSICAGVGEEIFFRGVLQPLPYLGIWITAIIFVAIHGYLNPLDWRVSIYGIYMTLLIALLGWFTDIFGLTTAMVAHTMVDVVLFKFLVTTDQEEQDDEDETSEEPSELNQASS